MLPQKTPRDLQKLRSMREVLINLSLRERERHFVVPDMACILGSDQIAVKLPGYAARSRKPSAEGSNHRRMARERQILREEQASAA